VTEPDDVLLGRADIERAAALGERLVRRGVVADVFVVGGAAMALAYDAARVTRDVDAVFKPTESSWKRPERSRMTSDCPTGG
jgi:predicted nucleic acid-binding protein